MKILEILTYKDLIKELLRLGFFMTVRDCEEYIIQIKDSNNYDDLIEHITSVVQADISFTCLPNEEGKKLAESIGIKYDVSEVEGFIVLPFENINQDFEDIQDYICDGFIENTIIHMIEKKLDKQFKEVS